MTPLRAWILAGIPLCGAFFPTGGEAFAGAGPMPLEAHLDCAEKVVSGRIVDIEDSKSGKGGFVHYGKATLAVDETLKGSSSETAMFRVVTWVSEKYGGAAPLRPRKTGDSGVWVIEGDDVSGPFGLLPKSMEGEARRILKELDERKWSEPVGGLQSWAMEVSPGTIIFAVRNVSGADIFVPSELTHGFIAATLTGKDGKAFNLTLSEGKTEPVAFCKRLPPGKTVYLHPASSSIRLDASQYALPQGDYSAVIVCKNALDGDTAGTPGERVKVPAWKGELKTPPFRLEIGTDSTP